MPPKPAPTRMASTSGVRKLLRGAPWIESMSDRCADRAVPRGDGGDLRVGFRCVARQEGEDVLHALADRQRPVDTGRLGPLRDAGGVVHQALHRPGVDVEPGECGEVGVERVRQGRRRVDPTPGQHTGGHALQQRRRDQGIRRGVGHERLAGVLHVQPRRERDHPSRQWLPLLAQRQRDGDGDGEVAAGGITDRNDVRGVDPTFGQPGEHRDPVLDLRGCGCPGARR